MGIVSSFLARAEALLATLAGAVAAAAALEAGRQPRPVDLRAVGIDPRHFAAIVRPDGR